MFISSKTLKRRGALKNMSKSNDALASWKKEVLDAVFFSEFANYKLLSERSVFLLQYTIVTNFIIFYSVC
jgi:hypothetical protein